MTVNKVILIGRLGNDPDVRTGQDNRVVTRISLGTNLVWNDRNTGERREETEWHRVVFFGRTAEVARDYLKKGAQVYVEGRLKTNKYQDKDGIEKYSTDIIAETLKMLGSKGDSDSGSGYSRESTSNQRPSRSSGTGYGTGSSSNRPDAPNVGSSHSDVDFVVDDFPF